MRRHILDLGVNGRHVGARYGRVRDDVGSAFALRGEPITCLFIIATEKVPGTEDRLLWRRENTTSTQRALRNIFSLSEKLDGYAMGTPLSGTAPILAMQRCTCILRETSSRPASECPSIDTTATMRGIAPRQCSKTVSSNATRMVELPTTH